MRLLKILTILLSIAGCTTTSAKDWVRFADGSLDQWLGEEAVPGLTRTFSEHPRFRNETIRVAVLDGEQVAGSTNGLNTATRDAIYSALLQVQGLSIERAEGPESCADAPRGGYYLAIDATASAQVTRK